MSHLSLDTRLLALGEKYANRTFAFLRSLDLVALRCSFCCLLRLNRCMHILPLIVSFESPLNVIYEVMRTNRVCCC